MDIQEIIALLLGVLGLGVLVWWVAREVRGGGGGCPGCGLKGVCRSSRRSNRSSSDDNV